MVKILSFTRNFVLHKFLPKQPSKKHKKAREKKYTKYTRKMCNVCKNFMKQKNRYQALLCRNFFRTMGTKRI